MKHSIHLTRLFILITIALVTPRVSPLLAQTGNGIQVRLPADEELTPVAKKWLENVAPDKLPEHIRSRKYQPASLKAAGAVDCSDPANNNWDTRFNSDSLGFGANDEVFAVAASDNEVYIGGSFTTVIGLPVYGIAVWRDNDWHALENGSGNGVDGFIYAIEIVGDNVYVGGQFNNAGGVPAKNIAKWNRVTETWSAVGQGVSGGQFPFVSSIITVGNNTYVGGQFQVAGTNPASNIALWNGSTWSTLGNGIQGSVNALASLDGNIYAGGDFVSAGGVNTRAIARWTGSAWEALGGPQLDGYVNALAVSNLGKLLVGGEFTTDGFQYNVTIGVWTHIPVETTVYNVAKWTGEFWEALTSDLDTDVGNGVTGVVRTIAVDGQDVYVAGSISSADPGDRTTAAIPVNYIARWRDRDTSNFGWKALDQGTNSYINAIAISSSGLYAGGSFNEASGTPADRIARWDGRVWKSLITARALGRIKAMGLLNNNIYAGGQFIPFDTPGQFLEDNQVAILNSRGWSLVSGMIQGDILTVVPGQNDNELLIGGYFITADNRIAVNVARWDAQTQQLHPLSVGGGVAGDELSFVSAIAVHGDNVYLGGRFTIANTVEAYNVVCWNQSTNTWQPLGTGLSGAVWGLAVDDDGNVYAGGEFLYAGNTWVNHTARWDGSTWQPMGSGTNKTVFSVAAGYDYVYFGGEFDTVNGGHMNHIARWNRSDNVWRGMGNGITSNFETNVNVLQVRGYEVFVGGYFDVAGEDSVFNVAWWNGHAWSGLGSGVNSAVHGLIVRNDQQIYVGGYFTKAGCKPSPYVALWHAQPSSVRPEPAPQPITGILGQNFPNPCNDATTIQFAVAGNGTMPVHLEIFDAKGTAVQTLVDETMVNGTYSVDLNASNLPAGPYYYRLRNGTTTETRTMIVVR